jgi:hypothetical protein
MKAKFKITNRRNDILFEWLIEERNELNKLIKKRKEIVTKFYPEHHEAQLLKLNSNSYKESKEMIEFCLENIEAQLLNRDQFIVFKSFEKKSIDDTNYMM